jgi:hypothetical protein
MFRVRRTDGTLTDMVNLARAKDAAISCALAQLNGTTGNYSKTLTQQKLGGGQ